MPIPPSYVDAGASFRGGGFGGLYTVFPLTEAGSQIKAGSLIQAGCLIEAGV